MAFMDEIKSAIEIIKLNEAEIERVSSSQDAFKWGLIILAIMGVFSSILLAPLLLIYGGPLVAIIIPIGIIVMVIVTVIGSFITTGIYFLLAKLFGGTGEFMKQWKPSSYIMIISVGQIVSFIPFLGSLISIAISIWSLVVAIYIIKKVHNISKLKAVFVALIPTVLALIVVMGLSILFALTGDLPLFDLPEFE